ncbi:hypothetical protein D3C87_1815070 [compost metagenome]
MRLSAGFPRIGKLAERHARPHGRRHLDQPGLSGRCGPPEKFNLAHGFHRTQTFQHCRTINPGHSGRRLTKSRKIGGRHEFEIGTDARRRQPAFLQKVG